MSRTDRECVVLSPVWNAAAWVERCIQSVARQTYRPLRHVWIDDASTDGTGELLAGLVPTDNLVRNPERRFAARNIWEVVSSRLKGNPVVMIVDGDDWLAADTAAEELMAAHENHDFVWSDYASFVGDRVPLDNSHRTADYLEGHIRRKMPWVALHPLTFKREHFVQIPADWFRHDGRWLPAAYDVALAVALTDILGPERCWFCDKVLYIYNQANGLNNHKAQPLVQKQMQEAVFRRPVCLPAGSMAGR